MRTALVTSGAITQRLDRLEEDGPTTSRQSAPLEGLPDEEPEVLAGLLRRLLVRWVGCPTVTDDLPSSR